MRENLKKLIRVQAGIPCLEKVKSAIEVKGDEWTRLPSTTGA